MKIIRKSYKPLYHHTFWNFYSGPLRPLRTRLNPLFLTSSRRAWILHILASSLNYFVCIVIQICTPFGFMSTPRKRRPISCPFLSIGFKVLWERKNLSVFPSACLFASLPVRLSHPLFSAMVQPTEMKYIRNCKPNPCTEWHHSTLSLHKGAGIRKWSLISRARY